MSPFSVSSTAQQTICSTCGFSAGSYNVVAKESSISGLSSGGYMAVQFHVAHSGTLRGADVTAGGQLKFTLSLTTAD